MKTDFLCVWIKTADSESPKVASITKYVCTILNTNNVWVMVARAPSVERGNVCVNGAGGGGGRGWLDR